ncbi:cytochrome c biogenesis CcdA family protein [Mycobacterium intracellulare]|uniref:cytochrome c biogenesis CcdA family protein n=1 Tax=Mycobacterium intracellulare TaxID=1767 RepID=UPI00109EA54F|nr:cytochrome c biogenesis protein CcdA [Mycobacterium intracellulare]
MNGLLVLAFTAGMLAPVNPCGFALLPAWITHTLGETDTYPLPVRLTRALRTGAALTVGFAGTLVAAGLAISAGARALITAMPWLGLVLGLVLVALGVVLLSGRSLPLHLSIPGGSRLASGPLSVGAVVLAGVGYAVASLSCSFAVLVAVIAQAQTAASYPGLLAVFAAYAGGAAAVLLLVSIATAVTGSLLSRRLGALARYGSCITAVVLLVTGACLAWYWLPAAAGNGATGSTAVGRFSALVTTWLQGHTSIVAVLAVGAVLAVAAGAWPYRRSTLHRSEATLAADSAASGCCGLENTEHNPAGVHAVGERGPDGVAPSGDRPQRGDAS